MDAPVGQIEDLLADFEFHEPDVSLKLGGAQ
jgi:hypothetical protein